MIKTGQSRTLHKHQPRRRTSWPCSKDKVKCAAIEYSCISPSCLKTVLQSPFQIRHSPRRAIGRHRHVVAATLLPHRAMSPRKSQRLASAASMIALQSASDEVILFPFLVTKLLRFSVAPVVNTGFLQAGAPGRYLGTYPRYLS